MDAVARNGSNTDEGSGKSPPKVTPESIRRGQRLEQWLTEHDFNPSSFAKEAGINKMTVSLYMKGELDIANMQQRTVEKLLAAMHVSDSWAQDFFEIPAEQRSAWRTFRDPPWGSGESEVQRVITFSLDAPLFGEGYTGPVGALTTYDPANHSQGLMLTRLPGRYVVAMLDALPGQAEVLGQFLGVAPA